MHWTLSSTIQILGRFSKPQTTAFQSKTAITTSKRFHLSIILLIVGILCTMSHNYRCIRNNFQTKARWFLRWLEIKPWYLIRHFKPIKVSLALKRWNIMKLFWMRPFMKMKQLLSSTIPLFKDFFIIKVKLLISPSILKIKMIKSGIKDLCPLKCRLESIARQEIIARWVKLEHCKIARKPRAKNLLRRIKKVPQTWWLLVR
jgi:hypothetical protein